MRPFRSSLRAATIAVGVGVASAVGAQQASPSAASAPSLILPPEQQIAAAISAAPAEMRADATVHGYATDGKFVTLRQGKGDMVCLASNPKADRFHVACYHKTLEPFMARGRELRAQGVADQQVDTVRFKEIVESKLPMPRTATMLYTLTGPRGSFDPATGKVTGAQWLYVTYIPFATTATTGISSVPSRTQPWIMFPGTPKAHIMYTPGM